MRSRWVVSNRWRVPGGDGNVKHAEDKGASGPLWHWLGCGKVRKRRNAGSLPTFSHSRIMIYQFELESIALHCPNVYTSMPRSDSTLSIDGTRHPRVASSFATLDSRHHLPCLSSVHCPPLSHSNLLFLFLYSMCFRLVFGQVLIGTRMQDGSTTIFLRLISLNNKFWRASSWLSWLDRRFRVYAVLNVPGSSPELTTDLLSVQFALLLCLLALHRGDPFSS